MNILRNLDKVITEARERLHNRIGEKCGVLSIQSDGTALNTQVHLNGVMVRNISKIEISKITPGCLLSAEITVEFPHIVIDGKIAKQKTVRYYDDYF